MEEKKRESKRINRTQGVKTNKKKKKRTKKKRYDSSQRDTGRAPSAGGSKKADSGQLGLFCLLICHLPSVWFGPAQ